MGPYTMKSGTPRPKDVWIVREKGAGETVREKNSIVIVLSFDGKQAVCMGCSRNDPLHTETHLIGNVQPTGLDYSMFIVKKRRTVDRNAFVRKLGVLSRRDMNCLI